MGGLYGVIGDPITQSLSPLIHRGWMRDHDIDADYKAFRIAAGELREGLKALEREGVRGLNVTMPHKMDVAAICESVSPLASDLGAVNTLSRTQSGGWAGDNTDYQAFLDDFRAAGGGRLQACPILVLGAGGVAQAVARGLSEAGFLILIANRTQSRAEALAETLGLPAGSVHPLADVQTLAANADAVVNTLGAGHAGETLSLGDGDGRLFYDVSYGKAARANLDAAATRGWTVADGLPMLVGQAALSFEIWHGVSPDKAVAETRCRQALELAT
ncbi:MAG: shikimate dehydrogenase [Pseudomonadota bacterium]